MKLVLLLRRRRRRLLQTALHTQWSLQHAPKLLLLLLLMQV
jgi:hypothetical protein